jgi:hypothetical protein
MFIINPQLSANNLNNDGYNELLDGIDRTIASLATLQYQNHVFGLRQPVDFILYERLCEYREILMDKFMGCNCLEEEYLIYIMSKVQKLIC